jgi:HSP20 family protein
MSILARRTKPYTDNWADLLPSLLNDQHHLSESVFSPKVDIKERKHKYVIKADLPGVEEKDIDVTLHDGVLTLTASHEQEKEEEDELVIRRERYEGRFSRSFQLGKQFSVDDVSAKFKNGVLKIEVKKVEEIAPESKKIPISS